MDIFRIENSVADLDSKLDERYAPTVLLSPSAYPRDIGTDCSVPSSASKTFRRRRASSRPSRSASRRWRSVSSADRPRAILEAPYPFNRGSKTAPPLRPRQRMTRQSPDQVRHARISLQHRPRPTCRRRPLPAKVNTNSSARRILTIALPLAPGDDGRHHTLGHTHTTLQFYDTRLTPLHRTRRGAQMLTASSYLKTATAPKRCPLYNSHLNTTI